MKTGVFKYKMICAWGMNIHLYTQITYCAFKFGMYLGPFENSPVLWGNSECYFKRFKQI